MANDSALVLVGPEDNVDTVIQKVRDAGAGSVELLVTEGAPALQKISDLSKLRRSATSRNIRMLLITSDAQTLNAARLAEVEAMSVQGTQVSYAPVANKPAPDDNPYATRVLPVAPPVQTDEEVLRGLDDLAVPTFAPSTKPPVGRETPVSQSDDEIFAALDSLDNPYDTTSSPTAPRGSDTTPYDDQAYAADLDAWNDLASEPVAPVSDDQFDLGDREPRAASAAPPRRFRPEDMELTPDERKRATTMGRRPTPSRVETPPRERTRSRREEPDEEFAERTRPRRRTNPLVALLPVIIVLALLAIGAYLFFGNRATVTVTPPQPVTNDQPFDNLVIPLNKAGNTTDATSAAVQAIDINANVVYTATGTVNSETSAPRNPAKGTVTLYNQGGAAFNLPQGTEFIGTNGQGQEVRFTSDDAASVPPSTTARQGAQIITNLGQAQVAITARSPGSASNIDANKITQIAIPGQQPLPLNGTLSIEHGPITGGDEQQVRVVTDADVQQVLAQALTGLYEQGRKALQDQATEAQKGWNLETSTVIPTTDDLSSGQGQVYDLSVTPPVGTNVDPANPGFSVAVRATFKGLATPANRPLPKQLETALPAQLANEGKLTTGLAPTINGWHWDGSRLTASGVLKPDGTKPALDAQTRTAIIEAIQGKSRADAQAALEDFKRRGVISDYTLPNVDKIPSLNFQLDLRVVQ